MNFLKTPVALIIFNRPDKTAKVFEAIRQAKPQKLLVIADGPRQDRPSEAELCTQTRSVVEGVDWDCEVIKNYSDINLGTKNRIAKTGLPWVFEMVEEAIILEDDCLPHPTFFRFCQELLEKYRDDERIMSICGSNVLLEWKSDIQDYHFSNSFSAWGWASWRRVWKLYDIELKLWAEPEIQNRVKEAVMHQKRFLDYKHFFDLAHNDQVDTWAYQMAFLCLAHSGLSIIPAKNLISNIGFGLDSTRNFAVNDVRANLPTFEVTFPLKEPLNFDFDKAFENRRYFNIYDRNLPARVSRKLRKWFPSS